MLLRIISFNLGVEFGQIIALAIMMAILRLFQGKPYFNTFAKVTNDGLIIAGFMLLLMQLHGYQHNRFPDEFDLNRDAHLHHHEDMQKDNSNHDNL